MDVCIDLFLKAFSAFVPIIVATYVYEKWHEQKEKEVLSNMTINIYEQIENVKFSIVKTENILFHLIRNNNIGYNREQQKQAIYEISLDFNKSTSKLITYLKVIKANSKEIIIKETIKDIEDVVDKINRLTLDVDSKYWSKGHLTLDQENKYIEELNKNIKKINDAINKRELEDILQGLIRYKKSKSV